MDILVAGGHGKVALRLLKLLSAEGHTARGLIRSREQAADLEAAGQHLGDDVELRVGGKTLRAPFRLTYGEVPRGRLAVCEDSFRTITIAVNQGSAAQVLRARRADPLVLARKV